MSFTHHAANLAHKGFVLGLVSLVGFQAYQISKNVMFGVEDSKSHPQEDYIQALRDKADDEYKKYYKVDHRDWYDKEDNSHLKHAPQPQTGRAQQ
mmetsp:Transcript_7253/g.12625  ORF Transcript_7253/g.12625 Transcript_7253/m.12625 type:complete len:95 (+) Transcript_7253:860-1144(+)